MGTIPTNDRGFMKKILLITYYFPPCGGAGVQRWMRILKYLPAMGWDVTVLTTNNGDYPIIDESLTAQIPEDIRVIRTKTPVFGNFYKRFTKDKDGLPYGSLKAKTTDSLIKRILYWLRINIIIPDARIIWNRFAYKEAVKLLNQERFDLVITSSPPHSTQLVGLKLKQKFNLKWVTDFRDPWADIFYLKSAGQNRIAYQINKRWEKRVIESADLNLVISDSIKEGFPAGEKITFTNSFDPADFSVIPYIRSEKFRIKYVGKITEAQDIESVITALNELPETFSALEFTFIGTFVYNPFNSDFTVVVKDYLPHAEAIGEMINAELLVLLINDYPDNEGMLTTKLFEYLGAKVPILCVGPDVGDAKEIIEATKAGFSCEYGDIEAIKGYVSAVFSDWQLGKTPTMNNNENYSIVNQLDKLDNILTKIIS